MKTVNIFNDVKKIHPTIYSDTRGSFSEDYNYEKFSKIGITDSFVQDNISISKKKGTIRGLHFQLNEYAQSKLIKVISGSILDVFIDLRRDSVNFEQYSSINLTEDDGWLYIPRGYAHGFCTLQDDTIVMYKVDNYFNSDNDSGIIFNDDFFKINWPVKEEHAVISEKDKSLSKWLNIKEKIGF